MVWKDGLTGYTATGHTRPGMLLGGRGSASHTSRQGTGWLLLPASTAEPPSPPSCGVVWEGRDAHNTSYVRYCKINLFEDTRSYKTSEAI